MDISQSFIFAAGRGERMKPLSNLTPKPLIKIHGREIISYIIERLISISSINKIIVNGFYLQDQIELYIKNTNNSKIIFSKESEKLETGGGILMAMNNKLFDSNKPILLINGDSFWIDILKSSSDIDKIIQSFLFDPCDIMLGLVKMENFFGYNGAGDFCLDEKTKSVFKIKDDLSPKYVFSGLQIIDPKILNNISEKCFSMNYFYKKLDSNLKILGCELTGKHFHIHDPQSIYIAEKGYADLA